MLPRPPISTLFPYTTLFRSQSEQNRKLESRQNQIIPDGLDYGQIAGLRAEARQKLAALRSEEHTSELQSRRDLVCRLLLEKKNIVRLPVISTLHQLTREDVIRQ